MESLSETAVFPQELPKPTIERELWCGFPGENHVVHLEITQEEWETLQKGGLIVCCTHYDYTVGLMPTPEEYGPADT